MSTFTHTFRKYAVILIASFRASAVSDLEYRFNIVMKVITDIIWYVAQLSVFEVLFKNTNHIAGWTLSSARVFMGVLFCFDAFWMLIFSENLDRMSDRVRKGELDLLLAKPVNSQFMLSFQKWATPYVLNCVLTFCFLVWALRQVPEFEEWSRLLLIPVLIPCSLAITYGIRFSFSATALIFTRAENINYIWYQIYRLGTRPDALYPNWLRLGILTILPIGFLASVPARLLLSLADWWYVPAALFLAAVSVYISTRYWRFALRFYASASS